MTVHEILEKIKSALTLAQQHTSCGDVSSDNIEDCPRCQAAVAISRCDQLALHLKNADTSESLEGVNTVAKIDSLIGYVKGNCIGPDLAAQADRIETRADNANAKATEIKNKLNELSTDMYNLMDLIEGGYDSMRAFRDNKAELDGGVSYIEEKLTEIKEAK